MPARRPGLALGLLLVTAALLAGPAQAQEYLVFALGDATTTTTAVLQGQTLRDILVSKCTLGPGRVTTVDNDTASQEAVVATVEGLCNTGDTASTDPFVLATSFGNIMPMDPTTLEAAQLQPLRVGSPGHLSPQSLPVQTQRWRRARLQGMRARFAVGSMARMPNMNATMLMQAILQDTTTATITPGNIGVGRFLVFSALDGTTAITSGDAPPAAGDLTVEWKPVELEGGVTVVVESPTTVRLEDTLRANIQVLNTDTDPPTPLSGINVTFQLATPDRVVVRALQASARAEDPVRVFTNDAGQASLEFTAPVGDWVLIATATAYNGTDYTATSNSFRVLPPLVPDRVSLAPAKATVPCGRPVVLTARVLSNTSEPVRRTPVTFGLSGSCMNAVLIDGRVNKAGSKTVVTDDKGLATIWLFNEGEPGSVAVVGVVSNGVAAIMSQPAHITFVEQEAGEEEAYDEDEQPPHPYYEDEQQHAPPQPEDKEEAQRPSSHDTQPEEHRGQHPQRQHAPEQAPEQAPEEHDRQQVQQREALRDAPLQQREALRDAPLQQREDREAPLREVLREAPPLEQAPPQQQRNQPQQKPQRNAGEQQTAQPRKRMTAALQSQQPPVAMPQRARAGDLAHPMAAQQPASREAHLQPEVAHEEDTVYVDQHVHYKKKAKHDRRKHGKAKKREQQYAPTKQYNAQAHAAEAARVAVAAMPA